MNHLFLSSAVFCFLPLIVSGQDFSREFGKIGQEEINLKYYPKDPLAEAVVLFDIGDSRFTDTPDYEYNIEFTRIRRVKVFTNAGVKYAEVAIPFYVDVNGKSETVKSLEAYCYNWENGQLNRYSLDPTTVFTEKVNDRWSRRKFVVPNVKPGSVIEYKYVLESPFLFNLPVWRFQDHIPTIFSKCVVRMIPFYEYTFIVQGTNRFDSQTQVRDSQQRTWGTLERANYGLDVGYGLRFQDLINTYVMKDVPAFRDESYITSDEDYLIKLDFQLSKLIPPNGRNTEIISTWPKLVQDMIKEDHFGKYIKSAGKSASKILESKKDISGGSQTEKSKALINYVKTAFKYENNGSIYCSKSPREFLDQKKGNSAEINLFLVALLKEAGIDASPVILSTRDHGRLIVNYPFLHYFNHVIVQVTADGQEFLCDATDNYSGYDRIPSNCINDKGLIIQEGDVRWANLNRDYNSIDNKSVTLEILPESLKAALKMVIEAKEFDASWYRNKFSNDTSGLKEYFTKKGIETINKITSSNFESNDLPYTIACEGTSDIEQLNDKLIISPYLEFYSKENTLTQDTRNYPVDLTYSNTESYNCEIKIPDGYKVLTLPEGFSLDNDLVKIRTNYVVSGNKINISSEYGFKKAVYPPSDYRNIKSYFDIIAKKFNEQIVLVKS